MRVARQPARVAALTSLFDTLEEGLALFDHQGHHLWSNRSMLRLLRATPLAAPLWDGVQRFAQHLAAAHVGDAPAECVEESVVQTGQRYRIRGGCLDAGAPGSERLFLVVVDTSASAAVHEEAIRKRYHLSRQQMRVAKLLVAGFSNQEIAARLHISPHTARHHTEQVLLKLGLRSRAGVAAKLLGE